MCEDHEMNLDDIINTYKEKFKQPPSLESVESEREETLKKVSNAQVLARLKDRIVLAYQILADVSRGKRKVPTSKVALLVGGLAYLALPFDLVCDPVPVAGFLDDGIVLAWIFSQCADLLAQGTKNTRKGNKHETDD
jgi:uncharacterized membrane protein YkvA (DUF1232 family)